MTNQLAAGWVEAQGRRREQRQAQQDDAVQHRDEGGEPARAAVEADGS